MKATSCKGRSHFFSYARLAATAILRPALVSSSGLIDDQWFAHLSRLDGDEDAKLLGRASPLEKEV